VPRGRAPRRLGRRPGPLLPAAASPADRSADRAAARTRGRHRPAPDRVGQPLRGAPDGARRGEAERPAQLALVRQSPPPLLGCALPRAGRRRRLRGPRRACRRRGPGGGPGAPPAADLGHPAQRRGQAAVPRPPTPPVRAVLRDQPAIRRPAPGGRGLRRTGRRALCGGGRRHRRQADVSARPTRRRLLRAAGPLAGVLLLAACGADTSDRYGSGDSGYISGDGVTTEIPSDERGEPLEVAGTTYDGEEFSSAAHHGEVLVLNV